MTASSGDRADRIVVEPGDRRPAVLEVISDPAMLLLLRKREAEGIHVDIRRRSDLGPLVAHGKLLMDDHTAALGRISLSTLALEFRRELAVVVRDRPSLDALEGFWSSLPTADAAPSPAGMPMELS